jgi:lipopolysaccharide transport system ATP-binding protein
LLMSSKETLGADTAIEVDAISKQYRKGGWMTLSETLTNAGKAIARGHLPGRTQEKGFWALSDVSVSIKKGEIVGVVGNNGAGKSTFLKILSRITTPTKGRVAFTGRVGSLLEVGTGFHPELNGRDNIYLNGVILGMSKREIARQFDEIVAFSGVESFIDMPVKYYSSGMYMRLAFAVAAHLESEILLVDEVLAVGDANFQKKCIERMSTVSRSGRTVLFVSHNLTAVQALCQRTLWFEGGKLSQDGHTEEVLSAYLRQSSAMDGLSERIWHDPQAAPGNDGFRLRRVAIAPEGGRASDPIGIGRPFAFEVEYWNGVPSADLDVTWLVHNAEGMLLYDAGSWDKRPLRDVGFYMERCVIPADLMNNGPIYLTLEVHSADELVHQFTKVIGCELLDSENGRHGWFEAWHGAIRPRLDWTITKTDGRHLKQPEAG